MTGYSGALVQGSYGVKRSNFELVIPAPNGEGLVHYSRDNDTRPQRWGGPSGFGMGPVDGVALIQGDFGVEERNLEVLACEDGALVHYWREDPSFVWYRRRTPIAYGVRGTPGFVRRPSPKHPDPLHPGRETTEHANFEVVVPLRDGGLGHWWRDNRHPHLVWEGPVVFGAGAFQAAALTQSNFLRGQDPVPPVQGMPFRPEGNLEVVARRGGELLHFFREEDTGAWSGGQVIPLDEPVAGAPVFIQSNFDGVGNFLVLTPLEQGGLLLLERQNDRDDLPWSVVQRFPGETMSVVGLVQSSFGQKGNLEFVARRGQRLEHHWFNTDPLTWRWERPRPVAIEHLHAESDGRYGWNAAYLQEGTHIIVPIELVPDPGITDDELKEARDRWRAAILRAWNCNCRCQTVRRRDSAITFEVEWLPAGGGPLPQRPYDRATRTGGHHRVRVVRWIKRAPLNVWGLNTSGDVAAHEFGHMLGLPDEYETPLVFRAPVNTGTLMHVVGGRVDPRLVEHLCAPLCSQSATV